MSSLSSIATSTVLIFVLFLISRYSIQKLFQVCLIYFQNNKISLIFISSLLLPGTIVHELSHAFMAMILHLKIRDIRIFPEWKHDSIKLGSVVYEKKDVFRSILVGIAPFFVGLFSLWWLYELGLYQTSSAIQFIGVSYLVFVISTTMFSSKQDLVDILYIIPIVVFIIGLIYVFQINMGFLKHLIEVEAVVQFLYAVRTYILIAIGIHTIIIMFAVSALTLHQKS